MVLSYRSPTSSLETAPLYLAWIYQTMSEEEEEANRNPGSQTPCIAHIATGGDSPSHRPHGRFRTVARIGKRKRQDLSSKKINRSKLNKQSAIILKIHEQSPAIGQFSGCSRLTVSAFLYATVLIHATESGIGNPKSHLKSRRLTEFRDDARAERKFDL